MTSRSPTRARGVQSLLAPVALTLAAVALVLGCDAAGLFGSVELSSLDARMRALRAARQGGPLQAIARPARRTDQLIVVVFDDASMNVLQERLPLPRRIWARFLDQATQGGAKLVLMDVFLHGKSRDPEDDRLLLEAIQRSGRAVFARRWVRDGQRMNVMSNPTEFREHMFAQASVLLFRDDDSITRHYHTGNTDNGRLLPSMALLAVVKAWDLKIHEYAVSDDGSELTLAHDPEGRPGAGPVRFALQQPNNGLLLDFAESALPYRVVSFHELDRTLAREPDLFRDKLVMMGLSYESSHDIHPVPLAYTGVPEMAGVFIHGIAIRDLLHGGGGARVSRGVQWLAIALWLLAGGALFARLGAGAALGALAVLTLGWAALAWYLWLSRLLWLATVLPCAGAGLLWVGFLGLKLREEGKNRKSAETLLASYFSPAAQAGLDAPEDGQLADKLLAAKEVLAPDKYEITGKLGQGGMSVVFRAVQRPIGRLVALKFISPRLYRDRDAVARFLREARLMGQLMHPNLVTVFDSGESHGVPYIALELVDGENLKSLVQRRGKLAPAEAAGILKQTLAALTHVHGHGIIHRDIKSENILIGSDGVVKLTDFGIAKSDAGDPFETMSQVIVGTPAYLAPEQIRGEKLTPAADLYSLGVVLYEMLTGGPPFLGESTGAILLKHLNDQPPEVADLGVELPRGLLAVLRRCLAKVPAERYESAAELAEAIERLNLSAERLAGVPSTEPHISSSGTVSRQSLKIGGTTERIVRDTPTT